ncbi:MAG: uroporphyrinogen decarboxylase family protein [Lentisphaeria bacterium]|jgi:uroporphyrinogen decarboxylase|nr:uroporphyrinogen decarboxylase family protein [Lentisphaeria bacterium]
MTGRERMLQTLRFEEPDRPPHFETMFELEQEAFGLLFPDRREWDTCTAPRKREMIETCVEIYQRIVETYGWDALAVFWPWSDPDGVVAAKAAFGDRILVGSIVGGSVWAIEAVQDWMQFSIDLIERPELIHAAARRMRDQACARIDRLADAGADFILLVNDIAGNGGTFVSPQHLREFVLPYLGEEVARIRARGVLPFIHTDGNIMAILDDWLNLGAACYQSVDPMAGMDLGEVKQRCQGRLALMGNVQCSLLQHGSPEAIRAATLDCLRQGAPGGGYILSTSNTIFPGMPLANYEHMLGAYREFCGGKP